MGTSRTWTEQLYHGNILQYFSHLNEVFFLAGRGKQGWAAPNPEFHRGINLSVPPVLPQFRTLHCVGVITLHDISSFLKPQFLTEAPLGKLEGIVCYVTQAGRWKVGKEGESSQIVTFYLALNKSTCILGKRIWWVSNEQRKIGIYSVELSYSWQLNNFSLVQWMINPAFYKFCSNADVKKKITSLKSDTAQSLDIFLVSASSVRGFLSHLRSLLLPRTFSRTWKAISFLEVFSPLHCSQAVVVQQHFCNQSNIHILILLEGRFPVVLNLTTTFKPSIVVQFLLHGLLYVGWILDKGREILAPWSVFEQNTCSVS